MGEGIRSSLLLELAPEGRFSHLELSTAAGLLTLHPEGDGTLHGNAVTTRGIEHVRGLPWAPATVVLVEGSAVCEAIAASSRPVAAEVLRVGLDLALSRVRLAPKARPSVSPDGLPWLDQSASWPLDEDS